MVASIIAGQARTDSPGGRVPSTNPARIDDVVAEVLLGDAATFVDACRAAREAQPGWAATPAPVRGRAIQQVGRLVEQNKEALARLVTREIGKPYAESLGEVQEIVDTCDFFLGEGRRLYGQTVPSEMPDKQLFTFRTPVGVAAEAAHRPDLDDVRGEVVGGTDGAHVPAPRDQTLPRQEADRELLVLARRAHRDGQRVAVDADLERLLDRDLVLDPPAPTALDPLD